MYNLLMSSSETAFDGQTWKLERGRFGEYTVDEIRDIFKKFDESTFARLKKLPTVFWYEAFNKKGAKIGWIEDIKSDANYLYIEFRLDPYIPEIPFVTMMDIGDQLGISFKGSWEQNRTHWAVKDVDLLGFLDNKRVIDKTKISPHAPYRAIPQKAQIEGILVRPRFFEIPEQQIDRTLVSVMMPFGGSFDGVYNAIAMAARNVGMSCNRADNVWEHSVLMQDIFSLIYRSHVVVCDFSTKNPNVFYEAGIAHMLGRHLVPITQSADDVPFDLKQHRYIPYLNNAEGRADLTKQLEPRLQTLISQD